MKKRYIIIGGVILAVLVMLLLFVSSTQNGTLEITTGETPNNAKVEVSLVDENGAAQNFTVDAKSTRTLTVRTGTHRVNSKVGDIKAVDIVKIQAAQTSKLTLRFATQLTAQKIGTDAEYCPYMIGTTLYTYNCQGDGFIYRHTSADARKIPVLEAQYFGYIRPYATGFLGFPIFNPDGDRNALEMHFIDPKAGSMQKLTLPGAIPTKGLSDNVTIITPDDPTKTFFALAVRDQSKIYLFKGIADTNPTVISLPTNKKFKDDNNITSFNFDGDTFIAYIGKIVNGEQNDGQETDGSAGVPHDDSEILKSDGRIFEYDLSGKLTKTLTVPDDFWATSLTRLTQDYYAASNIRSTEVYHRKDGDRLELIYRLTDAVSAVTTKGQLYMVVDNGVFQFTPQENGLFALQNVYNDRNMRVSALYASPGPVLFTGFEGDSATIPLNVYSLNK